MREILFVAALLGALLASGCTVVGVKLEAEGAGFKAEGGIAGATTNAGVDFGNVPVIRDLIAPAPQGPETEKTPVGF